MDANPRLLLPVLVPLLPLLPLVLLLVGLLPPLLTLLLAALTGLAPTELRLSDFVYWLCPSGLLFGTMDLLQLNGHGVLAEVRPPWTSDGCAIVMPRGSRVFERCFGSAHAV
jgi:hypothetical protein